MVIFAQTNSVVQIGALESVVGILLIVAAGGVAWGSLRQSVNSIGTDMSSLKSDMKDIRERFTALEGKVSEMKSVE